MFLYFITFTIIFTVFGMIIFNQISLLLYRSVNEELLNGKETVKRILLKNSLLDDKLSDSLFKSNRNIQEFRPAGMGPRIIVIIRDNLGNIINEDLINNTYEGYLAGIPFNELKLDSFFDIKLENKYNYRGICFELSDLNNNSLYVQLFMNIDGEVRVANNFFKIIFIGTSTTTFLLLIASYMVSKKTLIPIVNAWKKQLELVENASHELRTPLSIMQGKQENLLQFPDNKIITKSDDIIITLREIKRLSKLTSDLMTLARADSSQEQLNKEDIFIDDLVKEVLKLYMDFAKVQNKEIIINLNYNKKICVDKDKINQLLVILLDNAIKYTSDNEKIEVISYEKDKFLIIEIKDTGIGISKEGMKHIFERFYRDDKARSKESRRNWLRVSNS